MINPTTKFSLGPEEDNAFQDLLENHLPLVRSIVERMKRKLPSNMETEDLYSIGVTGLVAAARNYRRSQERTFAAYAAIRISGAILDELRRTDWMSRANRSKARRLSSAISKLEQEQGGSISQESLCAEMQITEDQLTDLMEEARGVTFVSMDGTHEASGANSDLESVFRRQPSIQATGFGSVRHLIRRRLPPTDNGHPLQGPPHRTAADRARLFSRPRPADRPSKVFHTGPQSRPGRTKRSPSALSGKTRDAP
jgi:RNA polymerase sigma factor (sigma-70 family)